MTWALVAATGLLLTTLSAYGAEDYGRVAEIQVGKDGVVGFYLAEGIPNNLAANTCATSGWVGIMPADPGYKAMLAVLTAAQLSGKPVTVSVSGCLFNGAWNSVAYVRSRQ